MHASKKVGAQRNAMAPLWSQPAVSDGGSESGSDSGDPASQRGRDSTTSTSTERSNHCADDTSRDDHVLERHHAILVRAQTLHHFTVTLPQTLKCLVRLVIILQLRRLLSSIDISCYSRASYICSWMF